MDKNNSKDVMVKQLIPDVLNTAESRSAPMRVLGVTDQIDIAYIDMGQGDCTILKLPNDRVVIIDCGSSSGLPADSFTNAQLLLRTWANGNSVDVILTHPDQDHYNKIRLLVSGTKPYVQVSYICFSRSYNKNSPLGYYKEDSLGKNLTHLQFPMLKEVTINNSVNSVTKWTKLMDYTGGISTTLGSNELVLYSGKTTNGKAWSLSIIAGNVQTTSQTASIKSNCVSLITRVQLGNETMLLMGDATQETMDYLYSNQKTKIQNVSIFQLPHHGSDGSIPTDSFKNWVNPESLRISVGLLSDGYKLPRSSVIDSWLTCSKLHSSSGIATDSWRPNSAVSGYSTSTDLNKILEIKWKGYSFDHSKSGTLFWLLDPDDAGPSKSNTGFYAFTNTGYFLFRDEIKKDIWETGINGSFAQDGFTEIFI